MKKTPQKYRVTMYQEYYPEFVVEASSKVEAAELVMEGEGELADSSVKSQELVNVSEEPIEIEPQRPQKYRKLVLLEIRNCPPFVYDVVSGEAIDIHKVADHFEINEERDSVTFIEDVTSIDMDDKEL
tara:strand:- start:1037 stop:1420 length:384 start_codon:yes stop_codon:yes gene_type:complete